MAVVDLVQSFPVSVSCRTNQYLRTMPLRSPLVGGAQVTATDVGDWLLVVMFRGLLAGARCIVRGEGEGEEEENLYR